MLKALNATLHSNLLCWPGSDNLTEERQATLPGRDDNSYMYILFVMFLFAATVGSLILGYTRSRKVDKPVTPIMYTSRTVCLCSNAKRPGMAEDQDS